MKFKETTIKSRKIYKGRIVSLRDDIVILPNKVKAKREIVEHPGAVAVIAITAKKEIVLVRQFRKPAEKALLEIPAGLIKKGESGVAAARRELKEETGFIAKSVKKIMEAYSSPGYSSEVIKYYIAKGLIRSKQDNEEDERIQVEILKMPDAIRRVKNGKIKDNKTIIGIYIARDSI